MNVSPRSHETQKYDRLFPIINSLKIILEYTDNQDDLVPVLPKNNYSDVNDGVSFTHDPVPKIQEKCISRVTYLSKI